MKSALKKLLFSSLKLTKGEPFRTLYSGKVQILMFHRIVDEIGTNRISNDGIEVTKDYLEFLIHFYSTNGFTPASINDLPTILSKPDKKRYVIFTFDDGYLDNYTHALPVFKKHGVPFTVYIPIDFVKRKQFGWWYFIEDLIRNKSHITYTDLNGKEKSLHNSTIDQESLFASLRTSIQKKPSILAELITNSEVDLNPYYDLFLNESQLIKLAEDPLVTIGSHSVTHPSLAKLSDESSFFEIKESKAELEKILKKKVDHFSYPFGTINDVSEREIKNAERAGYLTAVTTSYGDVYKNSNILSLPRIWTSTTNNPTDLKKSIYGINAYHLKK